MRGNNCMGIRGICVFGLALVVAACGGGGSPPPPSSSSPPPSPTISSVTVSPSSVTLEVGQTQQFTAQVQGTGNFNSAVTWYVNDIQGGNGTVGTCDPNGLYTAPSVLPNPATVTVKATSVQDVSKSGTASVTVADSQPIPTITNVTVSPSSATVEVGQTQQFTAAVEGTGNFDPSVTWYVNDIQGGNSTAGTITSAGLYTAPNVVPSPSTITVKAASVQDSTKFETASVTVVDTPPASSEPTISISPASANVPLGESADFTLTVSGSPAPVVTCAVSGAGSAQVSGSSLTYSVPTTKPASWNVSIDCTATNSSGSATAGAQVDLEYPVSAITSITPDNIYCGRECIVGGVVISGSGFYEGGTIQFNDEQPISFPSGIDFSQIQLVFFFDTPHYNPGFNSIVISSPADGPGGGISDTKYLAFLGNQNTLAVSSTHAFQLDQAGEFTCPDGTSVCHGKVVVFDLGTGAKVLEFGVGGLEYGIAVDDLTGYNVITQSNSVLARNSDGQVVTGGENGMFFQAVAARGGYACVSQDVDGLLSSLDLNQPPPVPLISTAIGDTPWSVAMTDLPDVGLVCAVFNIEDQVFSVVKVPEMQLVKFLLISGLTPESGLPFAAGGWQLALFSLPSVVVTAVSQADPSKLANAVVTIDPAASGISVTVSPTSVTLARGATQHFTATVTGSTNQQVTWSVKSEDGGDDPGTITSSGLYTAPSVSAGTTSVAATSVADPAKSATAYIIDVCGPSICGLFSVGLTPTSTKMAPNTIQRFTATVIFNVNQNVSWLVNGIPGGNAVVGTISPTGIYTAPQLVSPAAGTAALLSQADKVLVLVNLESGMEIRRVSLEGIPFRIAADNVNGDVIVAQADTDTGLTRFVKVSVADGSMTDLLTATEVGFLASGFAVSPDGMWLYIANQDQFRILPNN